jgi:hypothetical protein
VNDYFDRWANTDKSRDVAQALQPFQRLAKELNCAVVLIRHLTKNHEQKAMYRGQGNISFVGKARNVLQLGTDPQDDEVTRIALGKSDLVGKKQRLLKFRVEDLSSESEPMKRKFTWEGHTYGTSDDVLQTRGSVGRPPEESDAAEEFLLRELEDGPVESNKIDRMREAHNISARTLERVAKDLGIKRIRKGKEWWFALPDELGKVAKNKG